MKKGRIMKLISLFILISFVIPVVFLLYRIITFSPTQEINLVGRTEGDYILMLLQCSIGILAFFLPSILEKRLQIVIPSNMYFVFVLFLYCAIFLGEVRDFYYVIPSWDNILHAFSGGMLGALGFSVINILNKEHIYDMNLSPAFIAFFAFCFAITLGVAWEIYEFTFDGVLGLNMQKFALQDGTELIGRAALYDTMIDLIIDAAGAGIVSIIGYLSLKYDSTNNFIKKILIERKEKKKKQ